MQCARVEYRLDGHGDQQPAGANQNQLPHMVVEESQICLSSRFNALVLTKGVGVIAAIGNHFGALASEKIATAVGAAVINDDQLPIALGMG